MTRFIQYRAVASSYIKSLSRRPFVPLLLLPTAPSFGDAGMCDTMLASENLVSICLRNVERGDGWVRRWNGRMRSRWMQIFTCPFFLSWQLCHPFPLHLSTVDSLLQSHAQSIVWSASPEPFGVGRLRPSSELRRDKRSPGSSV